MLPLYGSVQYTVQVSTSIHSISSAVSKKHLRERESPRETYTNCDTVAMTAATKETRIAATIYAELETSRGDVIEANSEYIFNPQTSAVNPCRKLYTLRSCFGTQKTELTR